MVLKLLRIFKSSPYVLTRRVNRAGLQWAMITPKFWEVGASKGARNGHHKVWGGDR